MLCDMLAKVVTAREHGRDESGGWTALLSCSGTLQSCAEACRR